MMSFGSYCMILSKNKSCRQRVRGFIEQSSRATSKRPKRGMAIFSVTWSKCGGKVQHPSTGLSTQVAISEAVKVQIGTTSKNLWMGCLNVFRISTVEVCLLTTNSQFRCG